METKVESIKITEWNQVEKFLISKLGEMAYRYGKFGLCEMVLHHVILELATVVEKEDQLDLVTKLAVMDKLVGVKPIYDCCKEVQRRRDEEGKSLKCIADAIYEVYLKIGITIDDLREHTFHGKFNFPPDESVHYRLNKLIIELFEGK